MTAVTGWFSKAVFYAAIVLALLLPCAALGYRFGLLDLKLAFGLLTLCVGGGLVIVILAIVNIFLGKRKAEPERVTRAWISFAIALLPVAILGFQLVSARGVPPIHNISTDVINPPEFDQVLVLRGETSNPASYGSESLPREKLAALQQAAYPDIQTLHSKLPVNEAFDRATGILTSLGLEIVNEDREHGLIEAVATTFWFGFKDDMVVRIQPEEGGTVIDLRSVSRVGQSDLGANAARIGRFLKAFQG